MAASPRVYPVRHPRWILTYAGTNITADVSGMVIEIEYSDSSGAHHQGRGRKSMAETDGLEIELEDRDRRWQGPWFPTRGDTVTLQIGYDGETLMNAGDFEVDELELKGPPDTMHMKCIAAGITPNLRTPRSAPYENQTLVQIANIIASKHGYSVTGAPQDINVAWARITQNQETDLGFLRRLALEHGYNFSVRGKQLVFYSLTRLEGQAPVLTIQRTQVKDFTFKKKTQEIYKTATVAYHNPATKGLVAAQYKDAAAPTGDDLYVTERAENADQASLKARSILHEANKYEMTGTLRLEGTSLLVAGVTVGLQGFGQAISGTYLIESSKHQLNRESGYETEIEIRQLSNA